MDWGSDPALILSIGVMTLTSDLLEAFVGYLPYSVFYMQIVFITGMCSVLADRKFIEMNCSV